MRALRLLPILALGAASLSVASPIEAATGSNGPTGFTLARVSVLGPNFSGVTDNAKHDGFICIKLLKTSGVFTDNVTP
ncbi:MAG: hypothetical protein ABIQ59_03110 [Nocardioidaceae bacterium]